MDKVILTYQELDSLLLLIEQEQICETDDLVNEHWNTIRRKLNQLSEVNAQWTQQLGIGHLIVKSANMPLNLH